MQKNDIENYIEKLKQLEKELMSDDDSGDLSFITELDGILNQLHTEVKTDFLSNPPTLDIKFKKLSSDAVTPSYSKDGDAGMDLTITSIISNTDKDITYGFGVALQIPKNYVGLVFPRSSIRKYDLSLTNCVGVIDSGYRGEIQATFKKTHDGNVIYNVGDRGAQIIILPYPKIKFVETDTLDDTERGTGGFGSTGS
jgi:dUTP pyrophosphatase